MRNFAGWYTWTTTVISININLLFIGNFNIDIDISRDILYELNNENNKIKLSSLFFPTFLNRKSNFLSVRQHEKLEFN